MKIGLLITIILSLVLSGCGLQQNDDFEKKVKCYELGKQYVDRLQKEADDREKSGAYLPILYTMIMSVYSKDANTCIVNYLESLNSNIDDIVMDLLNNKVITIKNIAGSGEADAYHNGIKTYLFKLQKESIHLLPSN